MSLKTGNTDQYIRIEIASYADAGDLHHNSGRADPNVPFVDYPEEAEWLQAAQSPAFQNYHHMQPNKCFCEYF